MSLRAPATCYGAPPDASCAPDASRTFSKLRPLLPSLGLIDSEYRWRSGLRAESAARRRNLGPRFWWDSQPGQVPRLARPGTRSGLMVTSDAAFNSNQQPKSFSDIKGPRCVWCCASELCAACQKDKQPAIWSLSDSKTQNTVCVPTKLLFPENIPVIIPLRLAKLSAWSAAVCQRC
jgi:hypothetical protein